MKNEKSKLRLIHGQMIEKLNGFAMGLEVVLTIILAIGIIIGMIDLVVHFEQIYQADIHNVYYTFKNFLGYTLLLVVGIELIFMLIYHSTNAILELVLFVIARKMLIYAETMLDLVLGTIAIAIVFLIIKFLAPKKDFVSRKGKVYSASTDIEKVMEEMGIDISKEKGKTLGGLVSNLAAENCKKIEEGMVCEYKDLKVKILRENDGVIDKVLIEKVDKYEEEEDNRDSN